MMPVIVMQVLLKVKRQALVPIFLYEWLDGGILDQLRSLHSHSQPTNQVQSTTSKVLVPKDPRQRNKAQ